MPREPDQTHVVKYTDLPRGIRDAGISRIETSQKRGTVVDLVNIPKAAWTQAQLRFRAIRDLIEGNSPLELGMDRLSTQFGVNERTVRRWIRAYRKNPEVTALLPRPRGPQPGLRRLPAESERLLTVVIDDWAARNERLPVSWIVEECRRRARAAKTLVPGRSTVEARLRDRGLEGLYRRYADRRPNSDAKLAMPNAQHALEIVQIDHTLVDVMVVDAIHRLSMGRPWITVAFDMPPAPCWAFT